MRCTCMCVTDEWSRGAQATVGTWSWQQAALVSGALRSRAGTECRGKREICGAEGGNDEVLFSFPLLSVFVRTAKHVVLGLLPFSFLGMVVFAPSRSVHLARLFLAALGLGRNWVMFFLLAVTGRVLASLDFCSLVWNFFVFVRYMCACACEAVSALYAVLPCSVQASQEMELWATGFHIQSMYLLRAY